MKHANPDTRNAPAFRRSLTTVLLAWAAVAVIGGAKLVLWSSRGATTGSTDNASRAVVHSQQGLAAPGDSLATFVVDVRMGTKADAAAARMEDAFDLDRKARGGGASGSGTAGGGAVGGAAGRAPLHGPLRSSLECIQGQNASELTPKEHDMQQQRRCALERAGGQPAGGYVAMCLAVKNQHHELPQWLDHYRALGVSQVYVMEDPESEPPLADVLAPYVQGGFVTHRKMPPKEVMQAEVRNFTCHEYVVTHKQLMAYAYCLRDHGANHQWMGFVDTDEYVVLLDKTPDLPSLLRGYEAHGALGVNWRMFGSSGHLTRQKNVLLSYTRCNAQQAPENMHVKVFANMAHVARISGPHDATHALGYHTVTASGRQVNGSFSYPIDVSRVVLNHYILRSKEEFEEKIKRGSPMFKGKDWAYWNATEATMTANCQTGVRAWQRLHGGVPKPAKPAKGKLHRHRLR